MDLVEVVKKKHWYFDDLFYVIHHVTVCCTPCVHGVHSLYLHVYIN